jgi:hypothetical protein
LPKIKRLTDSLSEYNSDYSALLQKEDAGSLLLTVANQATELIYNKQIAKVI